MTRLHGLTAVQAATAIATGKASSVELVRACLDRIDATDGNLDAWVLVDADLALREAEAADLERMNRGTRGPFHGVPFGVKDMLDVAGWPTGAGFAPYAGNIAADDSDVVGLLRKAGAIPIGKVSTAQFAVSDPPETVSPWNAELTPGGSSTGSGVAVAARHVPFALGTQTGGSILRPAAYNGVVGFKPSFGVVPTGGLIPTAPSLDHIGVLTRSVGDCSLFLDAVGSQTRSSLGRDALSDPPRLGVVREAVEGADGSIREPMLASIALLGEAGARFVDFEFGVPLRALSAAYRVIMQSEAAAVHADLFAEQRQHYGPLLQAYLDAGLLIPGWVMVAATRLREQMQTGFDGLIEDAHLDALLLPTTPSPPPKRASTGSSSYLSPFSLLGVPSVTLPAGTAAELPQAVQLVGRRNEDRHLLRVATWCEAVLGPGAPPPLLDS